MSRICFCCLRVQSLFVYLLTCIWCCPLKTQMNTKACHLYYLRTGNVCLFLSVGGPTHCLISHREDAGSTFACLSQYATSLHFSAFVSSPGSCDLRATFTVPAEWRLALGKGATGGVGEPQASLDGGEHKSVLLLRGLDTRILSLSA